MIEQASPDMNIGFMPIPINDRPLKEALVVSVPNYWAVNKQSIPEKKKRSQEIFKLDGVVRTRKTVHDGRIQIHSCV
ncbi:hypothetical protein RCO48_11770 [Peribacillus frigoritolerans]|nr:hypothetical protein [Peribacillus frigoritolerans]